jgi:single-stranded DNA-binding protein
MVFALGWVGREPVTSVRGERRLTTVTVATKRRWRDLDGRLREASEWHYVEGWDRTADVLAQVHPGDLVLVVGLMKYHTHEETGRFSAVLNAQQVFRVGGTTGAWREAKADLRRMVLALSDREFEVLKRAVREREGTMVGR